MIPARAASLRPFLCGKSRIQPAGKRPRMRTISFPQVLVSMAAGAQPLFLAAGSSFGLQAQKPPVKNACSYRRKLLTLLFQDGIVAIANML